MLGFFAHHLKSFCKLNRFRLISIRNNTFDTADKVSRVIGEEIPVVSFLSGLTATFGMPLEYLAVLLSPS